MNTNNRNSTSSGKKKGGGFLARHAKSKGGGLTELDLLHKDVVTAEDVLKLSGITESKLYRVVYIFTVVFSPLFKVRYVSQ